MSIDLTSATPDDRTCASCRFFVDDKLLRKCGLEPVYPRRASLDGLGYGVCAIRRCNVESCDTCEHYERG
jgi:hypothetical protein